MHKYKSIICWHFVSDNSPLIETTSTRGKSCYYKPNRYLRVCEVPRTSQIHSLAVQRICPNYHRWARGARGLTKNDIKHAAKCGGILSILLSPAAGTESNGILRVGCALTLFVLLLCAPNILFGVQQVVQSK